MPKYFLNAVVCVCLFVFAVSTPCAAQSWQDYYPYKHLDVSWDWGNSDIPQPDFSRFPPKPTSLESPSWSGLVIADGLDLSGRDLRNARIHLLGGMLRDINFDGANLEGAEFSEAFLINCSFRGANLKCATLPFTRGDMTDAILGGHAYFLSEEQLRSTWNFKNKNFSNTVFENCNFPDVEYDASFIFTNTTIIGGNRSIWNKMNLEEFSWNQISSLDWQAQQAFRTHEFRQKSLYGLTVRKIDFTGCDFSGFTLGLFENCNFQNANFKDATILRESVKVIDGAPVRHFGFSACHITEEQIKQTQFWKDKNLMGIILDYMDMSGWDFSDQNLTYASLQYSSVKDANFEDALLYHTDLSGAGWNRVGGDLYGLLTIEQLCQTRSWKTRRLIGCVFERVNFDSCDLSGFDFSMTKFIGCSFKNANLTGATMQFPGDRTNHGLTKEQLRSLKNFHENMLLPPYLYGDQE